MSCFHEEQRFRQWWMWTLLAMAALPVLVVVAIRGPALPVMIVPLLLLAIGVLIAFARLVVDVDRVADHGRLPLSVAEAAIPVSEVRSAIATKCRAFIDYGGYGVRYSLFRGWAWSVSGDEGVMVETRNGSRLMIGSRRPKELEAAIARAMRGGSA